MAEPLLLRDEDFTWSPAELRFLTDLIGVATTFRLIEMHHGTRIRLPHTVNQGTRIARDIGLVPARKLARRWGGDNLKVPLARYWRVRVYREQRLSYSEIARRVGITEGTVHRYLQQAEMTAKTQQLDFFQAG
ncbi:winged helix-turn-helix transcriptional regulator [Roseomonas sp. HJA6]|uniref:Winged helix-turn-helix transcriptional regulator n=1 Tax=Roseomonas alba TaxID=2846776 RepID=A0ABS7AJ19_9PROT|nr:sigma factor-like helix-turn-helix DNA-binding protein [Neoroseomonas alba]MBW6402060.1 winged helix-turn-helix transcriptional regulator [Neoroseomonas alba]